LWEGPAAVATAMVVNDQPHTIDAAGIDRGFLIVTDQKVIVGHRTKFRGKPEPWGRFAVEDLHTNPDHPKGVAFLVTGGGPVDVIICAPSRGLDDLRRAVRSLTPEEQGPTGSLVHVHWGKDNTRGASIMLVPDGDGQKVESWRYDEGTPDDMTTSMFIDQALGELDVSLGNKPTGVYTDPRPGFMGEFTWIPPLSEISAPG
jgi:hypothetical protein